MKTAVDIAFGAAVSLAVLYGLWNWFGAFGLVFGAPVLAVFAVPLVDVVTGYPRLVSRLVMRKVEGRYFAYRGMSLDIDIDEHAACWISTADVRKLVPATALVAPAAPRISPAARSGSGRPATLRRAPGLVRASAAAATARPQIPPGRPATAPRPPSRWTSSPVRRQSTLRPARRPAHWQC